MGRRAGVRGLEEGRGRANPGFALVFTTYWKCGPGNAAHVLCSVLSALVQTLQGPEESVLCPPHPGVGDTVCGECRQMPQSMHWEWK